MYIIYREGALYVVESLLFSPKLLYTYLYRPFQYLCSPYLWGPAAVEHHAIKKMIGNTLYKHASICQVLDVIDEDLMFISATNFPVDRPLKVFIY